MDAYFIPIKYALITFPVLAALLTIPFLIYQYRKYGYVNKFRSLILYSFWLYMLSAYYLVILPLPKEINNGVSTGSLLTYMQLSPFHFIQDIARETNLNWSQPASYLALFKEQSFLQVLFNVVLTMPLGIYMRYYFRRNLVQTLLIAAVTSLFFELTQLSGLYGLYSTPYRLFDIDDLMMNTLGGAAGYVLAPLFTYFLPRSEELDKHVELESMEVGFIRRGISFIIDTLIMAVLMLITLLVLRTVYDPMIMGLGTVDHLLIVAIGAVVLVFLYMIMLPTITGGKTLGKMVTRIHVVADKRRGQKREITFIALLKRYGLLYYVTIGFISILLMLGAYGELPFAASLFALLTGLSSMVILGIHLLLRLFSRDKLLFYERISGTRNVITVNREHDESSQQDQTSLSQQEEEMAPALVDHDASRISESLEPEEKAMRDVQRVKQDLEQGPGSMNITSPDEPIEEKHTTLSDDRQNTMRGVSHSPFSNEVERELERLKKKLEQQKRE